MSTKAYEFNSELACRIANLNAECIQKLDTHSALPVSWVQTLTPDSRAKAGNLLSRCDIDSVILEQLESKTKQTNAVRRGRPMRQYKMADNGPLPEPEKAKPAKPAKPANNDNAMESLTLALARVMNNSVSEEKVRQIVGECVKDYTPSITTVEVKAHGEKPKKDLGVQHKQFQLLWDYANFRMGGFVQPIYLPGPTGSGKTTAAKMLAKGLGLPFYHTGALFNKFELLGFNDAKGDIVRTAFRECYEHGGVFLWDELDASLAQALVAFNAALENGSCAFPDKIIERHKDCIFIAAANTWGDGPNRQYVGRNKIDSSTIDRYLFIDWHYDEKLERAIANNHEWVDYVLALRHAKDELGLDVIISPRASIRGAAMLKAGFKRQVIIDSVVRKGTAPETWTRITAKAGVK